jgi:hypothetical protein
MILGLDISTSIVGYCVLDDKGEIYFLDHIDLRKIKNFWDKSYEFKKQIGLLVVNMGLDSISRIVIEDPLAKFTKGRSTSHTLSLLLRFNALCSFHAMELVSMTAPMTSIRRIEPEYISATHARRVIGVKLLNGKKKPPIPTKHHSGKEYNSKFQTFDYMNTIEPFASHEWPRKRTGRYKDHCYDEMDSYVVARAGFLEGVAN